ncbi:MAG: hypothetical protein WD355_02265 [Balneolaceae bacterium]
MANNPKFSTGFRDALINNDLAEMFEGGELHIYSGTQPTDADADEGAGTLLAVIALPADEAFENTPTDGILEKAGTWEETSAPVTGTAAWFRLYDSAVTTGASVTAVRLDGTVGTATSDLIIDSTSITSGDSVVVDTFSITLAA